MNPKIKKLAEQVVEDYFKGNLKETNFRVYNNTLCPDLWDEQMHLDATIRAQLLKLANEFYEKTKFTAPIIDIWVMGSIANFNWTPDSDIDVHIVIDFSQLQMPHETASKVAKSAGAGWNSQHDIRIKGHKVEINIHSVKANKPYIMGIYSLPNDQWVKKPVHFNPSIDKALVQQKYSEVKKYVDGAIQTGDYKQMKDAKDFLDEFRQYGLDTVGELSTENIVYKILRSKGYVKGLKDSITHAYDKQMTIPEINQKDIPAVHPKNLDSYDVENHEWLMDKINLSNLIALRDKMNRFLRDSRSSEDAADKQRIIDKIEILNQEIKRRLAYINSPVAVSLTEALAPMSDEEVWGDKSKIPNWDELDVKQLQAMREKAGELWYYAKKIEDLPLIKRALRMSELITLHIQKKLQAVTTEGYGAGIPEEDPLHIPGERWRIKWNGRKTPKMTKESVKEFVNEFLSEYFND